MFRIEPIKKLRYPKISILLVVLAIYTLIIEFMIPGTIIFPKPSLIVISFFDIFIHYPVLRGFLDTIILVLLSVVLVYFSFKTYGVWLCRLFMIVPSIRNLNVFSKTTPPILFAAIIITMSDNYPLSEFLILLLYMFFSMTGFLFKHLESFPQEYLDQYITLNIEWKYFVRQVIWKGGLTGIKKHLSKIIFSMWSIAIVFEFMGGSAGIGHIIRLLIYNNDYYGLISLTILASLFFFVVEKIIALIVYKTTYWEG